MIMRFYNMAPSRREWVGWRGPCPVHGSSSIKSRTLSYTEREWYCWKCRIGGDVIRLFARIHRLTDYEAARRLREDFDHHFPKPPAR